MMKHFENLLRRTAVRKDSVAEAAQFGGEVAEYQRQAEDKLPVLLKASGLGVWRPGDPVEPVGRRVLVGVGAWNRLDLQLLDALAEAGASHTTGEDRVEVFQFWRECQNQEQLDQYIPGMDIASIFHSPVVGVWENGILKVSASGAEARKLLVRIYGLPANLVEQSPRSGQG